MIGHGSHDRERGVILIVVLWIVASLSLLLSAANSSIRANNSVTRTELITAQLEGLADAGVELAVARLFARGPQRWKPDGRPYRASFGGALLRIRISDANALVDLNKSSGELLFSVFRANLGSDEKAARLRNWVLASRPKTTPGTKENAETSPGPDNQASRGPGFADVSDLLNSRMVSPRMMDSLRSMLTVYSKNGKLNPVNASARLLATLPDISQTEVSAIVEARSASDRQLPFTDLLSQPARNELNSSEGPAYRISVEVISSNFAKPVTMTATILMGTTEVAPYYILSRKPLGF